MTKEGSGAFFILILAATFAAGCGKRGAPLPPLVKLPAAPDGLIAERRGDTVTLRFTVPRVNTDETRPANVARVEVYALTGPLAVTDDEVIKLGTRVGTVAVKTPRNPNDTIEPGEPEDALAPLAGTGLDQGAVADVRETLGSSPGASPSTPGPLARTYIGVGVTAKGRRGALSTRVSVPIGPPPPAPRGTSATYDERAITVVWQAVSAPAQESGTIAYHVYEVPPGGASGTADAGRQPQPSVVAETRLTSMPVTDTRYLDTRLAWGATRCFVVRAVLSLDVLAVEGDEAAPACVMLTDTFPPAAPTGLQAVAGEGTISLIWDANTEMDLAGYRVLRAARPGDVLMPITPTPIRETTFRDTVQAGIAYVYAVAAVDRAGNMSPPSNRVEESAR